MIKGVGLGPSSRIEPVRTRAAEQGGAAPTGVSAKPGAHESAGTALSQMLADGPPVDSDRVAELRARIAEGSYAVDPGAIAEKMIALDLGSKGDA